jgi:hypothetical protein
MADFCDKMGMMRVPAIDLANRWFQPLTHVSGGGFPRDTAICGQGETRETRKAHRFAVAQRAAHSVSGVFRTRSPKIERLGGCCDRTQPYR